ncbi:photosynthetic complex putative assembly protein PuhB [Thiocystis violacea]|uniref:photosynthetic complex putative assembly protein PuhB n=1 Tax=Thiocystis violacea TaxID=13725 RepID=UPI0019075E5A|nr:phosphopantetheine adenylyltransferase [Thiocystis violacea]
MKEYDFEPVRGLPEQLPPGEELLWQGAPRWTALARRAFHVRKVAIYFAVLVVLRIAVDWSEGPSMASLFQGVSWILVLAVVAVGALALLGWAMARTTVYTITSRRVVMRIGVALPMMMNVPFKQVRSADLKVYDDGTGDIPFLLAKAVRPSYMIFWPHVRPWHFSPPQPMFRAIPEAGKVAEILAGALKAYAEEFGDESNATDEAPAGVHETALASQRESLSS